MKITYVDHIGIAVKNLENAIEFYEKIFGIKCQKIEEIEGGKVKIAVLKIGETKIELLQATDNESPIAKFIEKRGQCIHHIAFAVENLKDSLRELENKGIALIDKNPRKGADEHNIAFLHPSSTLSVLIELCEKYNTVLPPSV